MDIRVVRRLYVGMVHDVFQLRGVHALACHLRAEGVAADMRRDLWKLLLVDAVVLRHRVLIDGNVDIIRNLDGKLLETIAHNLAFGLIALDS